ncbi:signal peptidase 22kDa subunit [Kalaharituber pfeilii]|nr:signal peptidase 22kDa subunit [Kalaharituber pfeilii]
MHSTLVRAQNLFGFFTTVTFFVAFMVATQSWFMAKGPADVDVGVNVRNVQVVKGRQHQDDISSKGTEFAFIKFDLDADLTPLFNWNTKQIFAYLTASYPGPAPSPSKKPPHSVHSDAVIWDVIIRDKSKARITLRNQRAKYNINDVTRRFAEQNATLTFAWNVQPHVGLLAWGEKGVAGFTFPGLKKKKEEGRK